MNHIEMPSPAPDAEALAVLKGPVVADFLRDETLAEIFTRTAIANATRTALMSGDIMMTYGEVLDAARAIARGLMRRGIGVGDVVGLWLPRGVDLLISQIGITLTGAAWLPFDAEAPVERIGVCLADADAKALLTSVEGKVQAAVLPREVLCAADLVDGADATEVPERPRGLTREHPAYLIYTSGSTGVPKGIVISQGNICHYLRAAQAVYELRDDDVVFQGASVAFDLSMEEIWVPYLVGATLYVATADIIGETEFLAQVMNQRGITVLDTVPTLLAMLTEDVPSLRVIILGGEACPPSIAEKWAREGRTIFNSYGPTEATVVATVSEVNPGEPVTIGGPIPNYSCYVVGEDMRLLKAGEAGELLIGGPGVATGYLKRDELTREKFIANPFPSDGLDPVLYRSGDGVIMDAQGRLLFQGRIDDQVKIRGFRVELGEIESRIQSLPQVVNASVVLRRDNDIDQLVAFIIPASGISLDARELRKALREHMPAYMVPGRFETVSTLPRLTSGKVDRKALKALPLAESTPSEEQEAPETDTEAALLAAAQKIFPGQAIPFGADFFSELGGHSLLAAKFIGHVRENPLHAGMTLNDVYQCRTLRAMAARLDEVGSAFTRDLSFTPPPFLRRFLCGLAQAAALPFIFGLLTIQWLGLFLVSIWLLNSGSGLLQEMPVLMVTYVAINIGVKLLTIGLKWLVLGRTKPGVYPLWGVYYFRLWFVQRLVQTTTLKFLQCSPLIRWYMLAMGAKVGKDAMIGEFETGAIDMISIGDHVSTGLKVKFSNIEIVGNEVHVAPIIIGNDAYIGNSSVICGGAVLEEGAEVADLTVVLPGQTVGAYEQWDGSPARKTGMVDRDSLPPFAEASKATRITQNIGYCVSYIVMLMLGLLPIFPAFFVLYNLDSLFDGAEDYSISWSKLPFLTWPTALMLILVTMAVIIATRWLILPRVKPGVYSIHSWFYVRKWIVGLATEVTLETLNSLYATVYMQHWYRLMGAKIGKGSEISTNLAGRYDLIEIGENNFIGDEAIFGDEELRRGWMTLATLKTGDRVFFGNDAVVPGGAIIESDSLVGVKSKIPSSLHVKSGETWFGSPPMQIPHRQRVQVASHWTYDPPKWFKTFRYVFEALHTSLPTAVFITCGYITADVLQGAVDEGRYGTALGVFFAAGLAISAVLILLVAVVKWALMGRYQPTMQPMWSYWAMRTEAVAVLYGGLVGKFSVEYLRGTPFLPWVLRLYGARIGKGVCLLASDITEFDCVTIGDFSVVNELAVLQTHLYEDRIMKTGRLELGKGVTVGAGATVLYDTQIGDFVRLAPLTIVMKGEKVPANTSWAGAPSQPWVLNH